MPNFGRQQIAHHTGRSPSGPNGNLTFNFKSKTDKFDKPFEALITDLEQVEAFECSVLLKTKKAAWARMRGFTRTSVQQVIRRNKDASIESNYEEGEQEEALGFADAIGAMCSIEIAHLAGNDIPANEIFEKIKSNFPNKP